ncbi:MAG: T9SS C-terminal target domain-containing protein, partial [candidate division KSB1 bacterium]|nr:T9SS C-terminal target domain-containing protein [candidate division KSB1 bacterium]
MKSAKYTILAAAAIGMFFSSQAFSQVAGDYRSVATGNWSQASTWETFDGTNWIPAINAPTGTENITVDGVDTVRVDVAVSITGYVKVEATGVIAIAAGSLTFGDGSTYEHARDGGSVPTATWEKGSTALFTGITATAPDNRGQDYYNLTLNTPGLASNRDLNLQGRTIGGNLTVINTGSARWQLVGGSSGTVTIIGDVIVQAGQFATQGTSSTTNVVVEHHGNINVTGGNFSISRGTQGSGAGTTIWNLREGNFSMSNATTQNSNPTPGKAKFVFAKRGGLQNLTLANVTYMGGGLPIQVDTLVTLNMDTTAVGGNGIFALSAGATLISAHPNGVNGNLQTTGQITLSKVANFTFNGTVAQVAGTLLPDSVNVLTISNPAGVSFTDTLRSAKLVVPNGAVMKIDASGSVTADSGSVAGTVVNKGMLAAVAPLVFGDGSVYEHARDGGSVPTATWEKGSTALFTGITATAPDNRGQDYYNLTLNTPGLASNRDLNLQGRTIGGNLTVINTGSARWQMVGGVSGTVKIMGDVIVQAGQFATQGTSSTTNVVVEHHGNINVTGGNFSISRGTQGSGAGTTIWNLREGNFSMSNATTQNSNPTPGKAKFVFAKRGGLQNLTLANVTYMGGGLPIQVDTLVTLNMDTTAVGGNGIFALSAGATLIS